MNTGIQALLVHSDERPLEDLRPLLEAQGMGVSRARSCVEAAAALAGLEPPLLIFTDTILRDGTWSDVEALAESLHPATPVIVVSRFVDLPLYLDVLERGAADFLVPPFREVDVTHVVRGALLNKSRIPSGLVRATIGRRPEVIQHAQNHVCSRVRASHAQAGR
jgi:DNA-binding NtrC family response regulator